MANSVSEEKAENATVGHFEWLRDLIIDPPLNTGLGKVQRVKELVEKRNFSKEVYHLNALSPYNKPEMQPPVIEAIHQGEIDIACLLIDQGLDYCYYRVPTLINLAAEKGYLEIVVKLVEERGHDIDVVRGDRALTTAARWRQWHVVKYLIDAGADVNHVSSKDTLLHICSRGGSSDMCQYILSKGFSEINACDSNGCSALHIAVKQRCDSVVKLLLERGANVNQTESNGFSPLRIAVYHGGGSLTIVKRLCSAGADADVCSHGRSTPIDVAIYTRGLAIVHFMLVTFNLQVERERSLLSLALEGYRIYLLPMIVLLLNIGCPVIGEDYVNLSEYQTTLRPGSASRYIRDILFHPRRLSDTCCFIIRRFLGRDLPKSVDKLPLPRRLIDLVKLTHVVPDQKLLIGRFDEED